MESSILERLTRSREPAKRKVLYSKYGDEKVHKSTDRRYKEGMNSETQLKKKNIN